MKDKVSKINKKTHICTYSGRVCGVQLSDDQLGSVVVNGRSIVIFYRTTGSYDVLI